MKLTQTYLRTLVKEEVAKLNEGIFNRLPKSVIDGDLYDVRKDLDQFTDRVTSGNDVDQKQLRSIIKTLQSIDSKIKKFNNKTDVIGSDYE